MATIRTTKTDTTPAFYVFFPEKCKPGKLYGVIREKTNSTGCQYVYVTTVKFENGVKELGSFNSDVDNQEKSSLWIELTSKDDDIYVESLTYNDVKVPLTKVTLFVYDSSIVESEIIHHNPELASSECLVHLFQLLQKPLHGETLVKPLPIERQNSYWHLSKVVQQIVQRQYQLKAWKHSKSKLQSSNILSTFLFDLIFGFLLLQFFHQIGGTTQTLEVLISSIKVIADQLQDLIEWLMGVPYGLKLNRPLSTVLGKFFLYHLYLWKTYIDMISPFISIVISVSSTIGYIGLSFQMAFLSDLISVASLHCYCFYIYATRLYGLAQHGLRATLRMFGGRKYNPLRLRVDSGEFTWDELCVGMFIFCTLLFLLPTILVYYVVFLTLRLAVLILQGTLKRLIYLMNTFPTFTLLLWIVNSPRIAGDVNFEVVSFAKTTVKLKRVKLPLIQTLKHTLNPALKPFPKIEWLKRLKEMVSGQLIYPL